MLQQRVAKSHSDRYSEYKAPAVAENGAQQGSAGAILPDATHHQQEAQKT
jgi:hypothetical protein